LSCGRGRRRTALPEAWIRSLALRLREDDIVGGGGGGGGRDTELFCSFRGFRFSTEVLGIEEESQCCGP
jgi:hypothetical protein